MVQAVLQIILSLMIGCCLVAAFVMISRENFGGAVMFAGVLIFCIFILSKWAI